MFELTPERCKELEKIVMDKICPASKKQEDQPFSELYEIIAQIASRAAIQTIQEYEKMKAAHEAQQ